MAARNFVLSVFRDIGLPDVLDLDSETRFTSAFCTRLHAALGRRAPSPTGSSLVFGLPHHHTTTDKV
jgi:hypothetical protein